MVGWLKGKCKIDDENIYIFYINTETIKFHIFCYSVKKKDWAFHLCRVNHNNIIIK